MPRPIRPDVALDEIDRALLGALQDDGRETSASLARRVKLSAPGVQKRLHNLEERGVIRRYTAILDRHAVGVDLLCFIHVMLTHHRPDQIKRFPARIAALPEVLECHYLTGEQDYLLKVVAANHDELERFLFEKLMKIGGVDRIRTSIVLKEVKMSTSLPL
jgi:Lrp/AsnC family leucine-responsive transcriptional regulator